MNNVNHEIIMNKQLINMLSTVLDCGYEDITFVVDLCNDFRADFIHVWRDVQAMYGDDTIPTCNDIIQSIYDNALHKVINEIGGDWGQEIVDLADLENINYCASEFYFDGETIGNYDELLAAVRAKADELERNANTIIADNQGIGYGVEDYDVELKGDTVILKFKGV